MVVIFPIMLPDISGAYHTLVWDVSILSVIHGHVDLLSVLGLLHVKRWVVASQAIESIALVLQVIVSLVRHRMSIVWTWQAHSWVFDHSFIKTFVLGVEDTTDITLEFLFLGLHVFYGE